MNTHSPLRQIVREVKLDLPENWREMKAREVFDLSKPFYLLFDQAPPKYRELAERIERYVQAQPEFRFPELMEADKAAHISYYQNENGVRVPLPEGWEKYGRTPKEWWLKGYAADWTPVPEDQMTPEERASYERTRQYVKEHPPTYPPPPWYSVRVSMVQAGRETSTEPVTAGKVLEGIRDGRWRAPVARVHAQFFSAFEAAEGQGDPDAYQKAKDAVRDIKMTLPGVLFSGEFSTRANEHIIAHSGLLCIDLDHFQNSSSLKATLVSDAHVQAYFVSPTGSGLKILLRIEPDKDSHERSFLAAEKHFRDHYGIKIDNCKDVARLCFVSDDADIFIRAEPAALLAPLPPEPKPEPAPPPSARDIDAELTAKCGPAYYVTDKGVLVINESHFVQRICRENLVLFEYDERRFYRYNTATGAWEAVPPGIIKELARTEWERYTLLFGEPALAFKNKAALLRDLVSGIESHAGRTKVFKRLEKTIHCATGMLKINAEGEWDLLPFSPAYYARNPIPIAWDKDATCPKFDALLAFALEPDDVSLFWRWFGSVLLTGNSAQRILLFIGEPSAGKSTIAEVVEMVIGLINCTALRTKQLHERFEIGRLFGYTLLTAKDVPGDFLEQDGAQALKTLVGHDYIPGERKGSMESVPVYGDFDCMITCNERLLVRLEGATDLGAWKRRLMVFDFQNALPEENRIDNYSQLLFAEEGRGILRAAVSGAIAHLAELKDRGNFKETIKQKARVEHLLAESESIRYFVTERVSRVRGGLGVSTEELVTAYIDYCNDHNWRPYGIKQAERKLPDLMMSMHGVHVGGNIVRNKKRVRGYPHVALAQVSETDSETDDDQLFGETPF